MGMTGYQTSSNDRMLPLNSDLRHLSRDLRISLGQIGASVEVLLSDDYLSPGNAEYVRAILSGTETLKAVMADLLDRADTGKKRPRRISTSGNAPRHPKRMPPQMDGRAVPNTTKRMFT